MTTENQETKQTPATIELEKTLLKTAWVKEAELILTYVPGEDLSKTQKKLLQKCIDKEDFTDKQFADLKLILNKYRLILQKLQPEETLEKIDDAIEIIQTEQEFLDLMDSDEVKYLTVNLPYNNRLMEFTFEVLPLNDSRVIESLELQVDIFKDFDYDDAVTYSQASMKQPEEYTDEEKRIVQKINKMVQEKVSKQKVEGVDTFLANQLKIKGSDADIETRLKFWSKFHFNAKFSVFTAVQNRLGLNEISNERLFPSGQ